MQFFPLPSLKDAQFIGATQQLADALEHLL